MHYIPSVAGLADMTKMPAYQLRRPAENSATDVARDSLHVIGILVAARRCHLEQHGEVAGHHQMKLLLREKWWERLLLAVRLSSSMAERFVGSHHDKGCHLSHLSTEPDSSRWRGSIDQLYRYAFKPAL